MASLPLDPSEILWAAEEIRALTKGPTSDDVTIHERLAALIKAERSAVRTILEAKLPAALRPSEDLSVPVTSSALKQAGLTLPSIYQKDPTLHGKALVLAGIITSYADVVALGCRTFDDIVKHIGTPSQFRQWLTIASGTGSDQAWRTDILPNLKFSWNGWLATRTLLSPADLSALDFCLGTQLEADHPRRLTTLVRDPVVPVMNWLGRKSREEWVDQSRQLSATQYNELMGRR